MNCLTDKCSRCLFCEKDNDMGVIHYGCSLKKELIENTPKFAHCKDFITLDDVKRLREISADKPLETESVIIIHYHDYQDMESKVKALRNNRVWDFPLNDIEIVTIPKGYLKHETT